MTNPPASTGITDGLRRIIAERDAEIEGLTKDLDKMAEEYFELQISHDELWEKCKQLTESLASSQRQLSRFAATAEVVTYV